MDENLVERILRLPEPVRATLAGVPGPGWEITRGALLGGTYGPTNVRAVARCGADVSDRYAWWPENPARAVAAVLGVDLWYAYRQIGDGLASIDGDDHAAALSVIEAHVSRSTP